MLFEKADLYHYAIINIIFKNYLKTTQFIVQQNLL